MYKLFFKRLIDTFLSILGIILLFFPMIIIAIMIKLDSPGPILFKQKRIGYKRKVYNIWKFRTMCVGAEKTGSGVYSGKNDTRVTRVGKFLRNTSLDEITQLFNVLSGERGIIETTKNNADFSRVVTVNSISL